MAKKNKYDRQHLHNLSVYELRIDRIYQEAIREAAAIGAQIGSVRGDGIFSFRDYPATRTRVERLMQTLKNRMQAVVVNGIQAEWTLSNNKNSELARQVFGKNVGRLSQAQYRRYFSTNEEARQAFQERRVGGLNLSDRVWQYTNQFKGEIELGLDLGIRSGRSADQMSRDLRDYLRHPDKLFQRVRDEHGILQLSKRAAEFHPGQGVYRSSYKNARRLASTETNIAYRTADQERWKKFDFVVGIEVRLSNNHTCLGKDGKPHEFHDICDELAGRYPKDFQFKGWHPHCRCHAVSILKTQAEITEDTRRILNGEGTTNDSVNSVHDLPKAFRDWAEQNEERAREGRSLPYFIRDNKGMLDGFYLDEAINETRAKAQLSGNEVQSLAEGIARRYGATCTPINFKGAESIRRKVYSERGENPTFTPDALKDTVRTTIVASRSDIQEVISMLKDSGGFLRHKPQRTPLGYTGHIVNIRTKNGMVGEIQVNTARMIYAKEKPADARRVIGDDLWNKIHRETGLEGGLGHRFYEAYRVLDPDSPEAKRILEQSREYYRHFNS
jgi:hypothetical protein